MQRCGDALAQTGRCARARASYSARAGAGGRGRGRGRGGGRGGGGRGARGPGRHRTVILRLFLHLHFLHDWSAAGRHSTLHLLACSTLRSIHFHFFLSPTFRVRVERGERKNRDEK